MFGNLPKPTPNPPSNLVDELKKFGDRFPKEIREFGNRFPKELGDFSSGLIDDVRNFRNSRLIYDGCNAGFRVGSGGLVQLYRNKYCDIPQIEPPPEPTEDYLSIPDMPTGDSSIYFAIPKRLYTYEQGSARNTPPQGWSENNTFINIIKLEYPYTGAYRIPDPNYPNIFYTPEFYIKYERRRFQSMNGVYFQAFWAGTFPEQDIEDMRNSGWSIENSEGIFNPSSTYTRTIIEPYEYYARGNENEVNFHLIFVRRSKSSMQSLISNPNSSIKNKIETLRSNLSYGTYSNSSFSLPIPGRFPGSIQLTYQKTDIYGNYYFGSAADLRVTRGESRWEIIPGNYAPPIKPDPPPPPPKKDCCMSNCCPDNSNIEALLKLIIKRIGEPKTVTIFDEDLDRKGSQKADKTPQSLNEYFKLTVERVEIANRIMGIENFPVTVPDTMIEPFKEGVFAKVFKFIDGDKKRKINTITEFIAWMSEQDSAVLGQFHQVIEFQTEDNKSSNVVLPNVAEALKEIVLLTSQMAKQNNIQTELLFKMAAEIIATRAAAVRAGKISEDIQDYLDYPTQTKSAKIPTSISLPKVQTDEKGKLKATKESENYRNFLQSGEIKYTYDDWTGSNSLHDQLLDILQLAAMLRAIYYQRTDNG